MHYKSGQLTKAGDVVIQKIVARGTGAGVAPFSVVTVVATHVSSI